jgi:hypothetical protein
MFQVTPNFFFFLASWKGRSKSEAGAVEKCDTWVINIWVSGFLSSHLSFSCGFESCRDER